MYRRRWWGCWSHCASTLLILPLVAQSEVVAMTTDGFRCSWQLSSRHPPGRSYLHQQLCGGVSRQQSGSIDRSTWRLFTTGSSNICLLSVNCYVAFEFNVGYFVFCKLFNIWTHAGPRMRPYAGVRYRPVFSLYPSIHWTWTVFDEVTPILPETFTERQCSFSIFL